MTTQELKDAVKALNDSGLVEKKIKVVAVKAIDLEKAFLGAVLGIPEEEEDKIPDMVVDIYNKIVKEKKVSTPDPPKDVPAKKAVKKEEIKVETHAKGEKLSFLESLIAKGKFSKKELIDMYVEKYSGSPSSPSTLLADGKNPKYNRFSHMVIEKDGVFSFQV